MPRIRRDPPPFFGIPMVHAANGHLPIRQHAIYHPLYSQMVIMLADGDGVNTEP